MTSLRHPPDSLSQTLQPIVEIIHRRIAVHLNVIYCIIKRNGVTVNDTQLGNQGLSEQTLLREFLDYLVELLTKAY